MGKVDIERRLYEMARLQQGYFTARQAKEAGYSDSRFAYHIRRGSWIREGRGIYRLVDFPLSEWPDLVFWTLWSCNREGVPQGVFSHDTALMIHNISDVMPSKYHLIVPKQFRRYRAFPEALILHFGDLSEEDVCEFEGYRVTAPIRTLWDVLVDDGFPEEQVVQAMRDGLSQGIFSMADLSVLATSLHSERKRQTSPPLTELL